MIGPTPAHASAHTPPHTPPLAHATVVARLREAGCVFAEDEARLLLAAGSPPAQLAALVERRAAGEPLEQVLGWAAFGGLRLSVDAGVFVPRRRTELLAHRAAAFARESGPEPVLVDLCCGCGAVGALVAAEVPGVALYAVDIAPEAVACARRNLPTAARVLVGDLVTPLPAELRGRVDVLVANGPYVPTEDLHLLPVEARSHEPRIALDGGASGLSVLARVVAAAPDWLAPDGRVLVEVSERQVPSMVDLALQAGLAAWPERDDGLAATIVVGRRARRTTPPP